MTVTLTQEQSAIASGLQAGDVVVTDGQDKLQQGMTVVPQSRPANASQLADIRQRNAWPHESVAAVYSAAGRDVAADGGACCWSASSRTGNCRFPRCPKSIIRRSRW